MERLPTFFDHLRNSGLVELKHLKLLVEMLQVRKRIRHEPQPDYRLRVAQLQKVGSYGRLPPLEQYLARECLRLDWLNVWQISQLIEGRRRFTLGEYQILDSLGQGGYAHVFLGQAKKTSELVAIKVFQSPQPQSEALSRFLREAMLQESILHKNIVRLIDCGQDGNVDYLVFEYMAGGDVRRLIRNEVQLPILQSARIISHATEALAYLHRQGIMHRDVKPANILLTASGEAKLGDLGLCGFLDARAEDDPRFGKLVGTSDYMAPDHILNPRKPSPQWDIYSLGCTFYQMVTGTTPFPKGDTREKIMAHLRMDLIDPRFFREDLSEELSRIIARMLAKDPALRFPTMEEVQASLAPWCDEKAVAQASDKEVVSAETLQKLLEYSAQVRTSTGDDTPLGAVMPPPIEAMDLAAVGDVPLDAEIYELQKPVENGSSDFNFELPAGPMDEELPLRFDQKSLFEFVSTFEEATRIPYWKIDALSKLRRSLPLRLRLRFAKREVTIRRLARQIRNGYVPDPRCGGERSHIKMEPTLRWYVWWLLTARSYGVYRILPPPGTPNTTTVAEIVEPEHEEQNSNTPTAEYVHVRLPGHTEPIVIEVPPVIMNTADFPAGWNPTTAEIEYSSERSPRPFEPLTLLFWLAVVIIGLFAAMVAVGIATINI